MPPRSIRSANWPTAQVAEQAQAMRRGERINISENRAVLHTALRQSADAEPVLVDGETCCRTSTVSSTARSLLPKS